MRKIIHHLRRQSEDVRRTVLHAITLIVAVVMISLWIFSLGKNFSSPDLRSKISEDLQPFSDLRDNLANEYEKN